MHTYVSHLYHERSHTIPTWDFLLSVIMLCTETPTDQYVYLQPPCQSMSVKSDALVIVLKHIVYIRYI